MFFQCFQEEFSGGWGGGGEGLDINWSGVSIMHVSAAAGFYEFHFEF